VISKNVTVIAIRHEAEKQSRFLILNTGLLQPFLPRNDVLSIFEMGSSMP